jgi:hypothetical protein
MAIDLSNIIKEAIESILEANLSFPTPIDKVFNTSNGSLKDKNLVIINSSFKFEKIVADFKFIYPAYTASFIFNSIMMEESEPILEIDDDIADAIKEVTTQVSDSLETSINGTNNNELGSCKFDLGEIKLDTSMSYEDTTNLIKLLIKLENKDLEIYLSFNDDVLPYINDFIKNSEKEKIIELNANGTENLDELNYKDNNKEISNNKQNKEFIDKNYKNTKEIKAIKKNKKIKKLIIIISFLLIFVVALLALFVLDDFKEKVKDKNTSRPKLSKRALLLINLKNKDIIYSSNLIDIKKLNRRLALLTKYEILEIDVLEKEKLYKMKMQKLEEFANQNKEEKVLKKDLLHSDKKENKFKDNNSTIDYINTNKHQKLTFIRLKPLKYTKYKDLISQEITKNTNVSMCRDKNDKVYIYIGPIYIDTVVNNIMKTMKKQDAKLISITNKQFDEKCNF